VVEATGVAWEASKPVPGVVDGDGRETGGNGGRGVGASLLGGVHWLGVVCWVGRAWRLSGALPGLGG
jgi:hypothetical protein